jgi:hypothetical protein
LRGVDSESGRWLGLGEDLICGGGAVGFATGTTDWEGHPAVLRFDVKGITCSAGALDLDVHGDPEAGLLESVEKLRKSILRRGGCNLDCRSFFHRLHGQFAPWRNSRQEETGLKAGAFGEAFDQILWAGQAAFTFSFSPCGTRFVA